MLSQLQVFCYSCLFGIVLGVFYDIFRIIRLFFACRYWNIFIQDILYFSFSGIMTFLFILSINFGEVRFYILAGEAIGWIIYYLTIGEIMHKLSYKLVKTMKIVFLKIYNIIFKPMELVVSKIRLKYLKKNTNDDKI